MNPARAEVRGLTDRLLTVTRTDDVDGLSALLASLVTSDGRLRHLYEPVLAELVASAATALRTRVSSVGDTGSFTAEVVNADDDTVPIDEVDPALRAVLRAVLAQLGDDPADVRFQLALVAADPEPVARLDALWHALLWASMLEASLPQD